MVDLDTRAGKEALDRWITREPDWIEEDNDEEAYTCRRCRKPCGKLYESHGIKVCEDCYFEER